MTDTNLARRGFLLGTAGLGAGAVLAGCTSNEQPQQGGSQPAAGQSGGNAEQGPPVTIGFSAPAADHGWMAAMTINAKAQAEGFPDVTLNATEGTNDVNRQIAQVEQLINAKVGVLVVLPYDGKALTAVSQQAMDAGIPVINVDRVFDTPLAYRCWIGGDNYRMGVNAANFIAAELERRGVGNPIVGEITGQSNLPLTKERSEGFRDALSKHGLEVGPQVAAKFTPETGQEAAANLLQSTPELSALWNHDDDQGIGVMAAVEAAGRDDFFMVGGAGSSNMMKRIKADDSVIKATVLYSPSMASSAISLARLLGQAKGMSDLAEHEIPAEITTYSAVVTKENVDQYMDVGFDS